MSAVDTESKSWLSSAKQTHQPHYAWSIFFIKQAENLRLHDQ